MVESEEKAVKEVLDAVSNVLGRSGDVSVSTTKRMAIVFRAGGVLIDGRQRESRASEKLWMLRPRKTLILPPFYFTVFIDSNR